VIIYLPSQAPIELYHTALSLYCSCSSDLPSPPPGRPALVSLYFHRFHFDLNWVHFVSLILFLFSKPLHSSMPFHASNTGLGHGCEVVHRYKVWNALLQELCFLPQSPLLSDFLLQSTDLDFPTLLRDCSCLPVRSDLPYAIPCYVPESSVGLS